MKVPALLPKLLERAVELEGGSMRRHQAFDRLLLGQALHRIDAFGERRRQQQSRNLRGGVVAYACINHLGMGLAL